MLYSGQWWNDVPEPAHTPTVGGEEGPRNILVIEGKTNFSHIIPNVKMPFLDLDLNYDQIGQFL